MQKLIEEINQKLVNFIANLITAIPSLVVAIIILVGTFLIIPSFKKLIQSSVNKFIQSASIQTLVVQISSIFVWLFSTLVVSVILFPDFGIADIIGFLGVGSLAISFAFQDIFKNFLAGVLILLNEPFDINDQIIVNEFEGTIEDITIRSTRIRTYKGEQIVIPNSIVFASPVKILTDRPHRRTDLVIGLDYSTPLVLARELLLEAINATDGVLASPAAEVDVVNFSESSIDFAVRYWTASETVDVRRTMSSAIIALKAACDRCNYNIPFPIRTLYLENFNESARMNVSVAAAENSSPM